MKGCSACHGSHRVGDCESPLAIAHWFQLAMARQAEGFATIDPKARAPVWATADRYASKGHALAKRLARPSDPFTPASALDERATARRG